MAAAIGSSIRFKFIILVGLCSGFMILAQNISRCIVDRFCRGRLSKIGGSLTLCD